MALLLAGPAAGAEYTIFQGTQYPLRVHILEGREPGPTIMVQGGIQGDEITGFLTAQHLTGATLENGRLIIIPRANVPSIHKRQRLINVDLNRRFDRDYNEFYEDHLARAIRFFLTQSNAFIHLHEGSGFYHPVWVDSLRNPRRFGQSIIIDTPIFEDRIFLANYVNSVLDRLNPAIVPADFRFQLFSTDTFKTGSAHSEQLKSLTCYALTSLAIPAFAIEVSKDIVQVDWKVRQQLRATQLLLEQLGLRLHIQEPERWEPARLSLPAVPIGNTRLQAGSRGSIGLAPYAPIELSSADLGLEHLSSAVGVFASDRPEINLLHTPRLPMDPFASLEIRADGTLLGSLSVTWTGAWPKSGPTATPWFVCWHNGALRSIPAGHTLQAVVGDQLVLEGIHGGSREVLNLKGYVANRALNDGQDSGPEIILDPTMFLKHWLIPTDQPDEWLCRVVRETPGQPRAEFFIRVLTAEDGRSRLLKWRPGESATLPPGRYVLADAWSNGHRDKLLFLAGSAPLPWGHGLEIEPGRQLDLSVRQSTTFAPMAAMSLTVEAPPSNDKD